MNLIAAVYLTKSLYGNSYTFAGLFFLMVGVTHVSSALIYAFDISVEQGVGMSSLIESLRPKYFILSNAFIALSIFFIFSGLIVFVSLRKAPLMIGSALNAPSSRWAGFIFFLIGMPAFVITFKFAISVLFNGGYKSADISDAVGTWAYQLSNFLPISGYFILAGSSQEQPKLRSLGLLIISASVITALSAGSRTQFIMPILAYFWIKRKKGEIISLRLLYVISFLFVVSTPFVIAWRSGVAPSHFITGGFTFFGILLAALNNFGTYYYFVPAILQNFPNRLDYTYFDSIIGSLAYCLPNIASINANHIGVDFNDVVFWLGDNYFVNANTGIAFLETGYTFIGEAYQSFGLFGLFFLFGIGFFLGAITKCSEDTCDPRYIAFFASILGALLFYPRDSFMFLLRPMLWFSGSVLLVSIFLNRYSYVEQFKGLNRGSV